MAIGETQTRNNNEVLPIDKKKQVEQKRTKVEKIIKYDTFS